MTQSSQAVKLGFEVHLMNLVTHITTATSAKKPHAPSLISNVGAWEVSNSDDKS